MSCLLFKGKILKAINQDYNKRMAKIKSNQTKGTTNKFVPTTESIRLGLLRENRMQDFISKVSAQIIAWCVENQIDTIVIGTNRFWKQNSDLRKKENQSFVQLPFDSLRWQIAYRAERLGIRVIEQEESYTSKASFVNNDYIPSYKVDDAMAKFTGSRISRGLYSNYNGIQINADLNGSANIGRKALPDCFVTGTIPDFNQVIVITAPDYKANKANQEKQLLNPILISRAKARRLKKKQVILIG